VLIAVLVVVMLVPYVASLLSRFVFCSDLSCAAVKAVTIGMPNFASVGLPLLRAVYGPDADLAVAITVTTAAGQALPYRSRDGLCRACWRNR
jgi:malonate transporter